MYAGKQYTANVSTLERHAFDCAGCKHHATVVIVGLGTGSGASPLFIDNNGAQRRAHGAARRNAQKDIQRALAIVACPKCGHVDPVARAAVFRQALLRALGIVALCTSVAALVSSGGLYGIYAGVGVGIVAGVISSIVALSKETPVVFEAAP